MASLLAHALLIILLPGLARPAEQNRQLIVQLVGAAGRPGIGRAFGTQGSLSDRPGSGARGTPAPQLPQAGAPAATTNTKPAAQAPTQRAAAVQKTETAAAADKPPVGPNDKNRSAQNEATSVLKPTTPVVPKSDKSVPPKPADKPAAKPAAKPETKPAESAGPQQPKSNGDADKPAAKEAEPAGPNINKPGEAAPQKPVKPGSPDGQSDGKPGGSGSGGGAGDGGGGGDGGDGGTGDNPGGPAINPPVAPPGPSDHELQLLAEYGATALKRIKGQARNPEVGGEGQVEFEFDVKRDGSLVDVRIIDDSEHELLGNDVLEAARAAFNEAHEKIPFPKDVKVKQWTFRKTIKYPLY